MLNEGWRDQYDRMLRSHAALVRISADSPSGSAPARDALYHFFQDAYHLKDWLKNDPAAGIAGNALEALVDDPNSPIGICADICNGTKHLDLRRPRAGGVAVVSQSVTVHGGTGTIEHSWTIGGSGGPDALDVADKVVSTWQDWLSSRVRGGL